MLNSQANTSHGFERMDQTHGKAIIIYFTYNGHNTASNTYQMKSSH